MHRRTVHRWIAALALVAALGVLGARPAAAADLSNLRIGEQLASLWSAVSAGPAALWEAVSGWFGATEKPEKSAGQTPEPPPAPNATWTIDPNGQW
jgi:hypothetical protein